MANVGFVVIKDQVIGYIQDFIDSEGKVEGLQLH